MPLNATVTPPVCPLGPPIYNIGLSAEIAVLLLSSAVIIVVLTGRIISTSTRFRRAELALREEYKTLVKNIDDFWFGSTKSDANGLAGLVNSVINSRLGKYGDVSSDVNWLSSARRKKFKEQLSEETCWRLWRLFRESSIIYKERCSTYLDTMETAHNHPSLVCDDEKRTTTITKRQYNVGKKRIACLSSETNGLITRIYVLNMVKRFLQLLATVAGVLVLSYPLSNEFAKIEVWSFATVIVPFVGLWFVKPLAYPFVVYAVKHITPALTTMSTERLTTKATSSITIATLVLWLFYSAYVNFPLDVGVLLCGEVVSIGNSPLEMFLLLTAITAVTVIIFRDVSSFVLQRSMGSILDESFVDVINKFGIVYILILYSAAIILSSQQRFGFSPDIIILIYVFIMSLVTGMLGFATRDSLEDFFSGVMLRVNPPFEEGDRIILPSDEICDVTKMGMTMVTLYNVTLNAEIYVPNKEIAKMTITNISRPDLELRIQLAVPVRAKCGFLEQSEEILIDCAYAESEVDQALIRSSTDYSEKGREFWERHERSSIEDHVKTLTHDYPDLETMLVPIGDNAQLGSMPFKDIVYEAIEGISKARRNWADHVTSDNLSPAEAKEIEKMNQPVRLQAIRDIVNGFGILSGAIFSIADFRPELKEAIAPLVSEISKEPVVHSQVQVTEGESYALMTLNAFTLHLERRFEVENKLNEAIVDRLAEAKLLFGPNLTDQPESKQSPDTQSSTTTRPALGKQATSKIGPQD